MNNDYIQSVLVDERHAGFQGEVAKDELARLAPVGFVCGTPGRRCALALDALSGCSPPATRRASAACKARPGP
jgi:hypothetical protein